MLQDALRRHGYAARIVVDGRAALEALRQRRADLVLSDVRMPVMDGFQLCRAIKQDPALRRIPVILLTALSTPQDVLFSLEAGADFHIPKPYQCDYLVAKIGETLAHRNDADAAVPESPAALTFGGADYRVSATRQQALRLLLSTYEVAAQQNQELLQARADLQALNDTLEARVQERTAALAAEMAERQRAEEGLRQGQDLHRTILQTATSGFWLVDLQGRLLEVNQTYCRMSGYSEAELLAMRVPDLEAVDSAADIAARMQKVMTQGEDQFESRHRRKDGTLYDVAVSVQYLSVSGGRLVAFLRDISGRKRAEEALRASETQLRVILESTDDGILAVDGDGRVIRSNRRFAEMWRIPPALQSSADDRALLAFVLDQLSEPEAFQARVRSLYGSEMADTDTLTFKDGRVFERHSAAMLDGSRVTGRVWSFHDVTERRRAEAERDALDVRLQQAQKMESVGRLAGGVAHEFNNLLMGIMSYAELCRDGLPAAHPNRAHLDEITGDAQRAADIARQLLAFARKQTIAPRELDLNGLLAAMLTLLRGLLGEDIDLIWLPGPALWPVKVDPAQIDQILATLAANARDAINGVGTVTIETRNAVLGHADCAGDAETVPGDYVVLAVSDSGRGMRPETLDHLFEPFLTTKGLAEGTGLGLATAYGIVRQNHGFLGVTSTPGRGTTFTIHLPRHGTAAHTPGPATPPAAVHSGPQTVLLVEDEKSIRVTTALFLKAMGHTVLAAASPEEALRLAAAQAGAIDLLISDVVMPGLSGPDLAQRLIAQRPALCCLFMSGYAADVVAQRGVLGQQVHFLAKPFSRDSLTRKVREVLGQ